MQGRHTERSHTIVQGPSREAPPRAVDQLLAVFCAAASAARWRSCISRFDWILGTEAL